MADREGFKAGRRRFLVAGVGSVGGWLAHALGRPAATAAADGDVVRLGREHTARSTTSIEIEAADPGVELIGDQVMLKVRSVERTAIETEGTTGLYAVGFHTGVGAHSHSGVGLTAEGPEAGVIAQSGVGVAVYAEVREPSGVALLSNGPAWFRGRVRFDRSGKLTIPKGRSWVRKHGVPLTGESMVLATLQQQRPNLWIRAAVPYGAGDWFTIFLNRPAPEDTNVAWMVLD